MSARGPFNPPQFLHQHSAYLLAAAHTAGHTAYVTWVNVHQFGYASVQT